MNCCGMLSCDKMFSNIFLFTLLKAFLKSIKAKWVGNYNGKINKMFIYI